jgi:hypothetical protein
VWGMATDNSYYPAFLFEKLKMVVVISKFERLEYEYGNLQILFYKYECGIEIFKEI